MPKAPPRSSVRMRSSSGLMSMAPAIWPRTAATPCVPQRSVNCLLAGVVARGRRARLERGDHQALVDELDAHHMRGVLEGAIERGLSSCRRDRRGALQSKPILPGASGQSCGAPGATAARASVTGVERLVIDRDLFGGVLRRRRADRDHHRHRLADMHHALFRQRRPVRRDRHLAAAAGNRMRMRDRMVMRRGEIGGGQHRDHARRASWRPRRRCARYWRRRAASARNRPPARPPA